MERLIDWVLLGQRLKSAREEAGLSRVELAAKIGVSRKTVGNMENGRHSWSLHTAAQVAAVLRKPIIFYAGDDKLTLHQMKQPAG